MANKNNGPYLVRMVSAYDRYNAGETAGFSKRIHDELIQLGIGISAGMATGAKPDPGEKPSLPDAVKNESGAEEKDETSAPSSSSSKASSSGGEADEEDVVPVTHRAMEEPKPAPRPKRKRRKKKTT